jgi:hypothetical protein
MYIHEQLMKTRHDARLQAAARHRLAAEARRARPAMTARPLGRSVRHGYRALLAWAGAKAVPASAGEGGNAGCGS